MKVLHKKEQIGFYVVLIIALALSWYSLMTLGHEHFNLPLWLAIGASAAFDGAAIFTAQLAAKYAVSEDSAAGPRFFTFLFVVTSALLNVLHAHLAGYGITGMLFYGAPAIIAGILFELFLKYQHRKALRDQGRIVEHMPVFGKLAWILYPSRSLTVVKAIVLSRLTNIETQHTQPVVVKAKSERVAPISAPVAPIETRELEAAPEIDENIFAGASKDESVSNYVKILMDNGYSDKNEIATLIGAYTKKPVKVETVAKNISRHKKNAMQIGGYL